MASTLRLKRRTSGAAGAPSSLKGGEVAYNEVDGYLYIGFGDDGSGGATSIKAFAKDNFAPAVASVTYVIDGGGAAITTGLKGYLEVPFDCTIIASTLLADQTGSIVVNVWKCSESSFPPDATGKITASAPPTLTAAVKAQDTTLTGWTTSVSAGDILAFNVDSAATIQRVTLSLKVQKS
jgi:hypothetical protein